jgi:hypothetical protein
VVTLVSLCVHTMVRGIPNNKLTICSGSLLTRFFVQWQVCKVIEVSALADAVQADRFFFSYMLAVAGRVARWQWLTA